MGFMIAAPSPLLSPFVKQYWSMDVINESYEGCLQRIVPGGLPEIIFYFGDIPEYIRKERNKPGRVIASGQQTGFYDLGVKGRMSLFSVLFRPEGMKALFRLPPEEFSDNSIDGLHILGKESDFLCEKLALTESFSDRIEIMEALLLYRLNLNYDDKLERIADSINVINRHRAMIDVDKLAGRACLSIRQYERQFTSSVGIPPVRFLRIVRFQNSLHLRSMHPELPLTLLAIDSGYYDQSHMVSEYRKLSGLTPRKFFSGCEPHSDYFSEIAR